MSHVVDEVPPGDAGLAGLAGLAELVVGDGDLTAGLFEAARDPSESLSAVDREIAAVQQARDECRKLGEECGLPLTIVRLPDDASPICHAADPATGLAWLPSDVLAELSRTRITETARIVPTATGLQVAAVALPSRDVAVTCLPKQSGTAIPAEATVAAASQGWSGEQLDGWWAGLPNQSSATAATLLTLARKVIGAGDAKSKLEWELDSLAEQIDSTYEEITLLHFLAQNLQRTDDTADLARLCLERIGDSLHAECSAAWLQIDDETAHFLTEGDVPFDAFGLARLVSAFESHPWPQPLVRNHLQSARATADAADAAVFEGLDNLVVVPVHAGTAQVGWLLCANGSNGQEFGTVEASLLASIAVTLGTNVQNAQAVSQREEMLLEFVRSLVSSLDAKDPYTRGHSERVAAIGRALAVQLGCDDEEVEAIHLSGLLHDVGKIGIDDAVLCKPGHLTDEEFEQIKRHPVVGYQILGGIRSLAHILPGVRNHHESWDGSGYPDGLAGMEIPRQARILAVADSYDAMTSDRPYRNGMPLERLQKIFREGRGTQWDPDVIDAYFAIADDVLALCEEWTRKQPRA